MTVVLVDGPDGVGKTGYSKLLASKLGWPRLEMRPAGDTDGIEEKSKVFNAVIRDLDDQDVDLVIDRGPTSSIVYSSVFNRPEPEHAWNTIRAVEPVIVYLRCDAHELAVRYDDELFDSDQIAAIASEYDDFMGSIDLKVYEIDTTAGAVEHLQDAVFEIQGSGDQ